MTNPIKKLPKIIKTERLEMRQLDVTPDNAQIVFEAVKNENPADFYYNQICNNSAVPSNADEILKQMQICSVRSNGMRRKSLFILYILQIFLN